ncbi:MAG: amidohydrolase family protein [Patescibacteria group bacterium]|nr:amidohydrolase family protein [Patescibacteria group bacterium]
MTTLLKNCFLIDGTGAPGKTCDVLIENDVIKDIGSFLNGRADKVIDLEHNVLAPGFIDTGADSDHYFTLFTDPGQHSLVAQGVTTLIGGNAGTSLAPLFGENILSFRKWADPNKINSNWAHFSELITTLRTRALGVNFGSLVGHSTLRRGLLGDSTLPLNTMEYRKFNFLIHQSLEEGAFGLSFGLAYTRAASVSPEEIFELTKQLSAVRAVFSCYPRVHEGIDSGVHEVITIAKENQLNTDITHLSTPDTEDFHTALKEIEDAARDVNVHFDVSPYAISVKPLFTLMPVWATQHGFDTLLRYVAESNTRTRILQELEAHHDMIGNIVVSYAKNQWIIHGKRIHEIAENQNISVGEALLKILTVSENQAGGFISDGTEAIREQLLAHSRALVSSNGVGYDVIQSIGRPKIHPRSFGAFPRFLRIVRERNLLSLEKAVQKITGAVAEKFGIQKRGIIRRGNYADFVVFDGAHIKEGNTFEIPTAPPEGISFVFINGVLVYDHGVFSDAYSGRALASLSRLS